MAAPEYWDDIARQRRAGRPQRTWRHVCDALNVRCFQPWLDGLDRGPALKTDLYDEANGSRALWDLVTRHATGVVGIDLSTEMAGIARDRHGLGTVLAGDVRHLPLPDASFTVVVSNSTLDHLASLGEVAVALGELHRVLRPGGRLLITMDNVANPLVALRNRLPYAVLERLRIVPYRMGATCGPGRLRTMLVKAGFTVDDLRSAMHVPRLPAVWIAAALDRIAPPALGPPFVAACHAWERMGALPTRFLTGYFVAALATRRG